MSDPIRAALREAAAASCHEPLTREQWFAAAMALFLRRIEERRPAGPLPDDFVPRLAVAVEAAAREG